jgi:hypothetical protein
MLRRVGLALVLSLLGLTVALAERPPQSRAQADLVVVGRVVRVAAHERAFGGDGVRTDYVAWIEVERVELGSGASAGQVIEVGWFRVTKSPSQPILGAYGHGHVLKDGRRARLWLLGGAGRWSITYNSDGVENLD